MEPSGAERDGGKRRERRMEKRARKKCQRHYALKVARGKVFMFKKSNHFSLNHKLGRSREELHSLLVKTID